ncbi:MAG: hypothetical protein HYU64_02705 [Armatimonadetes bacterium]|nr:hypothetical protein [Armatimonadota bacterium]
MISTMKLYRLQQADLSVADLTRQLEELSPPASEKQAFDEALKALGLTEQDLGKARKEMKVSELELQTLETKLKTVEKKLYGGSVVNPKELGSLQKDLEQFQKSKGKLEEKMLDLMLRIEGLEGEEAEARKLRDATEKEYGEKLTRHEGEKSAMEARIQEARLRREGLATEVDAESLGLYDELYAKKNGLVVVKIRKDACGGCFMSLAENVIKQAKERQLTYCSQCGRILVAVTE